MGLNKYIVLTIKQNNRTLSSFENQDLGALQKSDMKNCQLQNLQNDRKLIKLLGFILLKAAK